MVEGVCYAECRIDGLVREKGRNRHACGRSSWHGRRLVLRCHVCRIGPRDRDRTTLQHHPGVSKRLPLSVDTYIPYAFHIS